MPATHPRVTALAEVKVEGAQGAEDEKQQLSRAASAFMKTVLELGEEESRAGAHEHWRHEAQEMLESISSKSSSENGSGKHIRRVVRVELEWRSLTYQVPMGRRRKRSWRAVLHSSSGLVTAGRLLAILGPTGCGKTSLLNALAARLPVGGRLEGEVLINSRPRGKGFRTICAYVMQDDVLFHNLTVRETFEFAAAMRLPAGVSSSTRRQLVSTIIGELGLARVQHTYVGNAYVRGVSGGERKRTNIGIQLLQNPSIIYLDEPTSGLDAFQAQNVMEALWGLAHSGRSVLATIHQPRSSIYKMFDLLLLLSEGRTIYFGPAAQAVAWFERLGFPCPAHFNPADFFLDAVSTDFRSAELEETSQQRIALLAAAYEREGGAVRAAVQGACQPGDQSCQEEAQALRDLDRHAGFPNSLPVEFGLLLGRAWKQQSRDSLPQAIAVVQTVVIGALLAWLYSSKDNSQTGVQDETGLLFFSAIFVAFNALFGCLNTFPVDRAVVHRERAGKMYRVSPYFLTRFLCDLPLRIFQGLLFGCIIYWAVGLRSSASAFFIFCALLITEALASQGLGIAVSAACRNEKVAFAVAPAVTVILILFGGFYINKESIPGVIRWIEWLSHLYWAFMGLAINDFRGREGWECGPDETTGGRMAPGCLTTGDAILDRLGFGGNQLWEAFVGLGCLILLYNALGYIVLRLSKPRFLPLANPSAPGKGQ